MAREISQRELRNESGEIMRALDRGEMFVVTRKRRFVSADAAVALFAGAPALDSGRFRADVDAVLDQRPQPRG
jgi:hypothetical protein